MRSRHMSEGGSSLSLSAPSLLAAIERQDLVRAQARHGFDEFVVHLVDVTRVLLRLGQLAAQVAALHRQLARAWRTSASSEMISATMSRAPAQASSGVGHVVGKIRHGELVEALARQGLGQDQLRQRFQPTLARDGCARAAFGLVGLVQIFDRLQGRRRFNRRLAVQA